jgi:putative phosphoesterase
MSSKIGVISDTHGILRPEALAALRDADHVIHAGDVGSPLILDQLHHIAPLTAVRGNIDSESWVCQLPKTAVVEIGSLHFYVLHNLSDLDLDPHTAGFSAVISGHSHRPVELWRDQVLYFNPGSAGPRRFTLPVTLGLLYVNGQKVSAEIVHLLA